MTEVALAVQFEAPEVETFDVAAFSQRVKGEYPQQAEHPAGLPIDERFDEGSTTPGVQFQIFGGPLMRRFWFLSDDETRLIQLQHDLLAVNWRQMGEPRRYPRYRALRQSLGKSLRVLEEVLAAQGKGRLQPSWCEITYINHIEATTQSGAHRPLDQILTVLRRPKGSVLPSPEDVQLAEHFRIEDNGEPIGRLHFSATGGYRTADSSPIWVLTVTARLRSRRQTLRGALDSLDVGHNWALRSFTELTTKQMQREWKVREERR